MAYELRDNSGSLFKNFKKENPNQPDMRGDAKIDGVEYFCSAWKKQDKNGNDWFSLSLSKKEARPAQEQEAVKQDVGASKADDLADDIQF